jgi:hypothetical protein
MIKASKLLAFMISDYLEYHSEMLHSVAIAHGLKIVFLQKIILMLDEVLIERSKRGVLMDNRPAW